MGGQNKDWETLYQLSTTDQEGRRPSLRLDKLDEQAIIRRNDRPTAPNPNTREFFNQINAALAQSIDKDLTVYLHAGSRYFCDRFLRASCSKNQQKSRDR
jgi:hypothetical protein